MLRKWEFIAKALKDLNAPQDIIDSAEWIDKKLIELELGYNTPSWEYYNKFHTENSNTCHLRTLNSILLSTEFCSACTGKDGYEIECADCKLGNYNDESGEYDCTSEQKYDKDHFNIVRKWVQLNARDYLPSM